MADYLTTKAKEVRTLSGAARSALEKLPAPAAVSVMEDMLRLASEGNNNNNNNSGGGGGGGGSVTANPVSREQMLEKLGAAVSDADLQNILKQQGIL